MILDLLERLFMMAMIGVETSKTEQQENLFIQIQPRIRQMLSKDSQPIHHQQAIMFGSIMTSIMKRVWPRESISSQCGMQMYC